MTSEINLMRNILIGLLLCTVCVACRNNTITDEKATTVKKMEDIISFSIIEKDNVHIRDYKFERKSIQNKALAFDYINNEDEFTLFCDTSKNIYKGKFRKSDTVVLDIEKTKYFTINGSSFRVIKLIGDKNVTDGSFSIFLSPDFGLLLSKSNTWRAVKIICPDRSNSNYVLLVSLLYRIQTDDDFSSNPIPDVNKGFTSPKFE